ncbi:hypothetical protein BU25DRAFT_460641 [Macroventuria anomochaeta]|uniref:Uncharacterized protein n=1 Tax=Macroventuria anomochaeta TaxID=301207 RepID=A0ACB6RVK0_9PLEO|nr:uncharacterized protein BU25DRAFT_460641 [Macroventuria anomochaeta]KAF2625169.1 hypothetical protein BU25DRAFT_460641 [Macroventuria anomochaeta]
MLFQFFSVVALLACAQGVLSAVSNFSLYAYGDNLPAGLKLFYADGRAYLGPKAPTFAAEAVNVTLALTDDLRFVASPEGDVSWSKQPSMYIGADAGDMKTVGFILEDEIPDGVTVKGFGLFGGWAYNNQKAGAIEMNFVASPANEAGLYQIKWNAASTKVAGDHVPISLRTEAPATPVN